MTSEWISMYIIVPQTDASAIDEETYFSLKHNSTAANLNT